ncbi:MAG: alpha/beta hydrolase [Gammaproteobacteria bacterium]|nr:alpha/beta hydrolase [Gammaproteobacteria bacterium]
MTDYEDKYYVSQDGLQLYYRDYASDMSSSAVPVMCIPGLTRNSRDFERLAAALTPRHRVICPDLRGRGRSEYDRDWRNYHPVQYALDIRILLEHLRLDRSNLVGTSLGGIVSTLVARDEPRRVASVVLNDIGPEINPTGLTRVVGSVGTLSRAATFEEAVANTRANYEAALPGWSEEDWRWYAETTYRKTDDGDFDLDYDREIGTAVRAGAAGIPGDPWEVFGALDDIPTLLLRGEHSDIMSANIAEKMKLRNSDLRIVPVSNRGHAPILDEPEALNAIVELLDNS